MELKKETARRIYKTAPDWFKNQLNEAFGKTTFEKKKYTDIKTFEEACENLDIFAEHVCNDRDTNDEAAYKKLKVVSEAINQGWTPDWSNANQRKWTPWFNLSSGFGFGVSFYVCDGSDANAGSRLCFESKEKSDFAGTQFIDLYRDFLK